MNENNGSLSNIKVASFDGKALGDTTCSKYLSINWTGTETGLNQCYQEKRTTQLSTLTSDWKRRCTVLTHRKIMIIEKIVTVLHA